MISSILQIINHNLTQSFKLVGITNLVETETNTNISDGVTGVENNVPSEEIHSQFNSANNEPVNPGINEGSTSLTTTTQKTFSRTAEPLQESGATSEKEPIEVR